MAGSAIAAQAATTERVVVDRYTGLALGGFDPVAYFTDARPLAGQPGFEVSEAGAVWRFRNEGNRAFFLAHPEIYGPQFGGYDPTDVARGVAVAGNPQVVADPGPAAVPVRPRGEPRRLCRRSRPLRARGRGSAGRVCSETLAR